MEKVTKPLSVIGIYPGDDYIHASVVDKDGNPVSLMPTEYERGIPATFAIINGKEHICFDEMLSTMSLRNNHDTKGYFRKFAQGDTRIQFGSKSIMLSEIIAKILKYAIGVIRARYYMLFGERPYGVAVAIPETYSPQTALRFKELIEDIEIDTPSDERHKLKVVVMLTDTAAEVMSYFHIKHVTEPQALLTIKSDYSTDICVAEADPGDAYHSYRGILHDSIAGLGADEFTARMVALIKGKLRQAGVDVETIIASVLAFCAYRAVKALNTHDEVMINDLYILADTVDMITVTKSEFLDICMGKGTYAGELPDTADGRRNLIGEIVGLARSTFDEAVERGITPKGILCTGDAMSMTILTVALKEAFADVVPADAFCIPDNDMTNLISNGAARCFARVQSSDQ